MFLGIIYFIIILIMSEVNGNRIAPLPVRLAHAGAVAAVLLTSACFSSGSEAPQPGGEQPAIETFAPQPELAMVPEVVELPEWWPACYPSAAPQRNVLAAERCLQAMSEEGSAALVSFGIEPGRAEVIAEQAEELLEDATGGLVKTDIEVVLPTDEAQEAFEAATAEGCVDTGFREKLSPSERAARWPSILAQTHMPELKAFDFVWAMSPLPSCEENVGGIGEMNGRFAEILAPPQKTDERVVRTIVHEGWHNMGLGHYMGIVMIPIGEAAYIGLGYKFANADSGQKIDLAEILDSGNIIFSSDFNRYYMGGGDELHPVHRDYLAWPKEALYEGWVPLSKTVGVEGVMFDSLDVYVKRFASIPMLEPMTIHTKPDPGTGKVKTFTFNSIALVPKVIPVRPEFGVTGADLYLVGDGNKIFGAGSIVSVNQSETWKFDINGVAVTVHRTKGGILRVDADYSEALASAPIKPV